MSNETTPVEPGTTDDATDGTVDAPEPEAVETSTNPVEAVGDQPAAEDDNSVEAAEAAASDDTAADGSIEEGGEAADEESPQGSGDVTDSETEGDDDTESDETESEEPSDENGTAPGRSGRRAQLEREGEVAADFLETLLDICDLDGDLDVDIDGDRAAVAIVDSDEGRVPRRLVGQDGQVLEALQELTRLAVQSETGERSRLMLDVAGHRAERRSELVALAKQAIEEVRSSGERRSLTPMTAFERKVVHDEVLAAGLVSESEGSEPRRFVVISLG